MKKIILVSDSKKFTKSATHVLNLLQESEPLFIVGGFLHSHNYAELTETAGQQYMGLILDLLEQDRESVDENIMLFEHYCQAKHIKYRLHQDNNCYETDKLILESRFADLLIINEKLSAHGEEIDRPKIDIKRLLNKAECPVLLLPEHYTGIKRLAITYDGKRESVFAMKQFCYLFPALSNLPTEIIYLSDNDKDVVPEIGCLKEYVHPNFNCMNICKLQIDPIADLGGWASEKKDVLIIAGSYSRSGLFNSHPDSFIDPILNLQQLPVFITHH